MVRYLLPLRFLMLIACLGALISALLMFALASRKLGHGAQVLWMGGSGHPGEIAGAVMGATDAFLFGVVLIVFAYAIAFGFVFHSGGQASGNIPGLMHVESVSELKHILVEVIIVYLVVDFTTDLATGGDGLTWVKLVKPPAIVLFAPPRGLLGPLPANDERQM